MNRDLILRLLFFRTTRWTQEETKVSFEIQNSFSHSALFFKWVLVIIGSLRALRNKSLWLL